MSPSATEYVVLLDEDGRPCGRADKATVHDHETRLHLAFSCWLLDGHNRTLLTRRASTKSTWPLVWTNSFCGHPAPGENPADAVLRRGRQELGVEVRDLRVVLPGFRYSARMSNGITENEICPVFLGSPSGTLAPDAAEVDSLSWVELVALPHLVEADPERFSPWLRLQLAQLLPVIGRHTDAVPPRA
jgi:isopentenyl-diphosphate delta-isomerase